MAQSYTEVERIETALPLELVLNQNGGSTGLSPVVAVRNPADGEYLDFDDDTFKAAGWTTRQAAMIEVDASNSPGHYQRILDVAAITNLPADPGRLVAEYQEASFGDASDVILLKNEIYDTAQQADLTTVLGDTNDIQTRLPAALVGGRMDSDVAVIQPNAVNASALATDAVNEISADVDTVLSATHGAGSWLGSPASQFDLRQGWSRSISPSSEMRAIVHLEQNGDRVSLPGGAALTYQAYDRSGAAVAGFSGVGTLRNVSGDSFFEIVQAYTPSVGEIIVIRATITGSGVGGGTHVGQTEVAFPAF